MSFKPAVLIASIFFISNAIADSNLKYYEEGADFSNEVDYVLRVTTTDTSPAVLFLSCNPESGLSIQLSSVEVMFPDTSNGGRMQISTTHKFEEAPKAETTNWQMNMMKYKDSWYQGDEKSFMEEAADSSQLNLRLNKRGTIYRFMLDGAGEYISTILNRC